MQGSNNKKFSVSDRIRSFRYAFRGLKVLLGNEHNFRIHLAVSLLAITLGIILSISLSEWIAIALLIGIVLTAEALNTAIEKLCDYLSPGWDEKIGRIKDICAAAVLISAVSAVICGGIIFVPRIWTLCTQ